MRISSTQREPAPGQIAGAGKARPGPGDEHGAKRQVSVAHRQRATFPAGLQHGADPGQIGVPRDVDMAGDQRVDLPGVVGEQHEVHRRG